MRLGVRQSGKPHGPFRSQKRTAEVPSAPAHCSIQRFMSLFTQSSTFENDAVGHPRPRLEHQDVAWSGRHQRWTEPEGFFGRIGLESDLVHLLSQEPGRPSQRQAMDQEVSGRCGASAVLQRECQTLRGTRKTRILGVWGKPHLCHPSPHRKGRLWDVGALRNTARLRRSLLIAADRDQRPLVCPSCGSIAVHRFPERSSIEDAPGGRVTLNCTACSRRAAYIPRMLSRSSLSESPRPHS